MSRERRVHKPIPLKFETVLGAIAKKTAIPKQKKGGKNARKRRA